MTARTGRVCRTKYSADVATFTSYYGMPAIYHETSAEMIKRLLRPSHARGKDADRKYDSQQ
jgi:hypothetical protein